MAENWQQGMVTEVYYNYGRFNNDQGKKRFVRAPFVLIKFQPVTDAAWEDYFMPAPIGGANPTSADDPCRVPLGYLTRQDLMMDQNEVGNTSPVLMGEPEANDTWKMFHAIGFI